MDVLVCQNGNVFCFMIMYRKNNATWNVSKTIKEIWFSPMTKSIIPTEKSKKQSDNTKTPPKTSISQRLGTDLGPPNLCG